MAKKMITFPIPPSVQNFVNIRSLGLLKYNDYLFLFYSCRHLEQQEAQLLLRDRATRKHATDR